jgi:hypothetical protein
LRLGLGLVVGVCMLLISAAPGSARATRTAHRSSHHWVATWAASVQAPSSVALSTFGEPTSRTVSGFDNQTVRNIVFTSVGGRHAFDGVIDFAKATQDRYDPQYLNPAYNSGDNLHPNDAGYQAMANAINLAMLVH